VNSERLPCLNRTLCLSLSLSLFFFLSLCHSLYSVSATTVTRFPSQAMLLDCYCSAICGGEGDGSDGGSGGYTPQHGSKNYRSRALLRSLSRDGIGFLKRRSDWNHYDDENFLKSGAILSKKFSELHDRINKRDTWNDEGEKRQYAKSTDKKTYLRTYTTRSTGPVIR
jgi:hypothetical protein